MLPTYLTDREVILCKSAPRLINSYEIRLALFMAAQQKLSFVLAVEPDCVVAADLLAHITRFGGSCYRGKVQEYSVYFGVADGSGAEVDGWVLGNREAWEALRASLTSERLRASFVPGAWLEGAQIREVVVDLGEERSTACNVDGEPVIEAIGALVETAVRTRGALFVQ